MGTTTDPQDPGLGETKPDGQQAAYLVLSEAERAAGFVRPVRRSYLHAACGAETTMSAAIAETYARNPKFYGSTFCTRCGGHHPVDEFTWTADGSVVGS